MAPQTMGAKRGFLKYWSAFLGREIENSFKSVWRASFFCICGTAIPERIGILDEKSICAVS